ncbi:hypothetical protein Baya_15525 [Bagarius yarrelli]|uniref:Uncharacterized protein n=1 Tax=Bagarius yarrelli TaxID=175774 RepID=A0A556VBY9_BAGYA|nr:hypothetical protein Baya_15525 [Bagarius yarrelli]
MPADLDGERLAEQRFSARRVIGEALNDPAVDIRYGAEGQDRGRGPEATALASADICR